MATRIYRIRDRSNGDVRLVEAANAPQALKFAAKNAFEVDIPKVKEVATLVAAGTKVETADEPGAAQ